MNMLAESDRAEHISFSVLENKGAESIGDGYGSTYKNSRMFFLKIFTNKLLNIFQLYVGIPSTAKSKIES